jgi:heme/copper-type cytochrome/quinol oxidase subunit 2
MVTIDPTQWAQLTDALASLESRMIAMQAHAQALQDYVSNGFVFLVWATLALLFIMAIMFYFMFRRPRR